MRITLKRDQLMSHPVKFTEVLVPAGTYEAKRCQIYPPRLDHTITWIVLKDGSAGMSEGAMRMEEDDEEWGIFIEE